MSIKSLTLILTFLALFVGNISANKYYHRHYIILVDQTTDLQVDDRDTFEKVYEYIKSNFTGDGDGSFTFDQTTDEISLYTFALPGAYVNGTGFTGEYGKIHSLARNGKRAEAYKTFVENLIQNAGEFSDHRKGQNVESFLNDELHPLFKGESSHYAKNQNARTAVTFSKYVYPVILEKEHFHFTTPASEYIIIIASNFQSGLDDIGTSQDRNTLIEMLGEKGATSKPILNFFEERFNALSSPFYQIPVFKEEYTSGIQGKNACPTALGYKLGLKSLQGVSTYITSNIDIEQTSHQSSQYRIGATNIAFNHDENLLIDSVELKVLTDASPKDIYHCDIDSSDYRRDATTRSYDFKGRAITLGNREPGDTLQFRYIFYTTVKNGSEDILPMVFVADMNVILTPNVFYPEITLFEKMALIIVLCVIIALAIIAWWAYVKRGKSALRGIRVKIWHVSNSRFMELRDYHVVDRDCWYMQQGEKDRLVNITGEVDIQRKAFARTYKLKVEYSIWDADNNTDFSFRPDGKEDNGALKANSKWYEVPLKSDGTFDFNAIAFLVDGKTPNFADSSYNILDMEVRVRARLYDGDTLIAEKEDKKHYQFIVRPEIPNAALWMAFDPGTSGACVAYGIGGTPTDKANIKIAYHTEKDSSGQEKQVSIFPSKIKIPYNSAIIKKKGNVDVSTLTEASAYDAEGDFYFGNLASVHEGRNSFQSIKKLLGYQDEHAIFDKDQKEVCKMPGRDLAFLLVKGLCNHFEQYIRNNPDVSDKDRGLFIRNGKFTPSRAIVAVPNNYTIVKAQDMVDSIKRTRLFEEVHYIYEAESVMMCFLRDRWSDITNNPRSYEEQGKFFVVFDMGGATINATAFSIEVITAQNSGNKYIKEIELSTIARVGFNVGGDDIDYAWIQILYNTPAVKNYLKDNGIKAEDHIKQHRTGLLKYVQRLKFAWIGKLSQRKLDDADLNNLWMNISSANGLPELGIKLTSQIDDDSKEYLQKEWRNRMFMKKYVFSAVRDAITELLSTTQARNIEIIFSGRTTLYPGIRDNVETAIKNELRLPYEVWDGFEKSNTGKSTDEAVKTAVATGACWYAMFSNFIKLRHDIVTSTFGYVDLINGKNTFIPLIERGTKLNDDSGELRSDEKIGAIRTPNLPSVKILQMLTYDYDKVMDGLGSADKRENDKVKHLVNQLVELTTDNIKGQIKSVAITVDDKNNFSYKIKMAGGQPLKGRGEINDADIETENSDAYAFSAMPCTEDISDDTHSAASQKTNRNHF